MTLLIRSALLLAATAAASSASRQASNSTCTKLSQRVTWGNLTEIEKRSYIQADLCLMSSPSQTGFQGAVTRWDDLQYPHISQTATIHGVGAFLPFHRYYMTVHERLIRQECGYTGRMPYWDEVNDLPYMNTSGIFVPEYFGGDGDASNDYCVTDGAFVNLTLRWNSSDMTTSDHCLSREFDLDAFQKAAQSYIDAGNAIQNYSNASDYFFSTGTHTAGHLGVGQIMADSTLSPGDPSFYLHHSYLDKLFWEWQQLDWPARKYDMGGPNTQTTPTSTNGTVPSGIPTSGTGVDNGPKAEYVDYFNDGGNTTTLNHTLTMDGLAEIAPNVTIGDVMDLHGDVLCVEYL